MARLNKTGINGSSSVGLTECRPLVVFPFALGWLRYHATCESVILSCLRVPTTRDDSKSSRVDCHSPIARNWSSTPPWCLWSTVCKRGRGLFFFLREGKMNNSHHQSRPSRHPSTPDRGHAARCGQRSREDSAFSNRVGPPQVTVGIHVWVSRQFLPRPFSVSAPVLPCAVPLSFEDFLASEKRSCCEEMPTVVEHARVRLLEATSKHSLPFGCALPTPGRQRPWCEH